jgi:hypothetical protein
MDMLAQRAGGPDPLQTIMPFLQGGQPGISAPAIQGSGGPVGDVEAEARRYFLQHEGYSRPEWRKVDSIIEQESGWNPNAVNESSGAAGLAQNISGFSQGYSQNDPLEQIRWLANYLGSHNYEGYGTGIDAAFAHKNATGWY